MKNIITEILIKLGNIYFKNKKEKPTEINRILIIAPIGIGDVLMTTPAIRALRNKFPKSVTIDCLMHEWGKEVLQDNPYINNILINNKIYKNHSLFELVKEAKKYKNYDCAIVFSHLFLPIFAYLCKIPIRLGYDKNGEGFALTRKSQYLNNKHKLDLNLDVVKLLGATVINKKMDFFFKKGSVNLPKNTIGVCVGGGVNPGVKMPQKIWNTEGFAFVCNALIKKGYEIVFLGSIDDVALTKDVIKILYNKEKIINYTGKTDLKKAAEIISQCKLFLCNDSALMHLAAAVDTLVVALFGPTDPGVLAPLGRKHIYIQGKIDKSKFKNSEIVEDYYNHKYINSIQKEDVLKIIEEKLISLK